MANYSSSRSVSSRTVKIFSVVLVLSLVLGLVLIRSSIAPSLPALKLEPKYVSAKAGEMYNVQVRVYGATYPNSEVYGWQIRLTWNTAVLTVLPQVTYGDFMSAPRVGFWGTLIYDAPAGQKNVSVTIGSDYIVGQQVFIKDNVHNETNSVSEIKGNQLIMTNNLANTYELAANAGCYPIPTLSPVNTWGSGTATLSVTTNGVNPGAQGDGLLGTLNVYVKQDVTEVLNITNQYTVIKTTLGDVVGDLPGELDKQNSYKAWSEDINADGIISGTDLFTLGRDYNKHPIVTRSPTVSAAGPGGAWTNPNNAFTPDYVAASANVNNKQEDYKTYGFPTTSWTGVSKVEVGIYARIAAGGDDQVYVTVSNDGGTSFSATTGIVSPTPPPPATLANFQLFWLDMTSAYAWTTGHLTNANFVVRITYHTIGGTSTTIQVDWVAARVTPTPTASNGSSDINRDNTVSGTDLSQLAGQFGKTYGP